MKAFACVAVLDELTALGNCLCLAKRKQKRAVISYVRLSLPHMSHNSVVRTLTGLVRCQYTVGSLHVD